MQQQAPQFLIVGAQKCGTTALWVRQCARCAEDMPAATPTVSEMIFFGYIVLLRPALDTLYCFPVSSAALIFLASPPCLGQEYVAQHPAVVRGKTRETHFFDWHWEAHCSSVANTQVQDGEASSPRTNQVRGYFLIFVPTSRE
eukprot:SAG31_NODE_7924_length_1563_cov_1.324454_2_plen_142_part_01